MLCQVCFEVTCECESRMRDERNARRREAYRRKKEEEERLRSQAVVDRLFKKAQKTHDYQWTRDAIEEFKRLQKQWLQKPEGVSVTWKWTE